MVRVALVGPYPADLTRLGGGAESSLLYLVDGLSALGDLDIHVVTFVAGADRVRKGERGSIPIRYLPTPKRLNNLTLYRTTRRLVRQALDEISPDIIHAGDALGYGYVSLKVARREPVVVTVHGIVREEQKQLANPGSRRARLQALIAGVAVQRYVMRHAKYLLQSTTYPQEYFGSLSRGQFWDVGNGIADRFFEVEHAPEDGRVLYAGAIMRRKRLLDLIEAVARVPSSAAGFTLRVAGAPREADYYAEVQARIRDLGLEERVSLLGPLSLDQLTEEYRRASVFVLPSAEETSPLVIGEAMAVGIPVIATRIGGIPHLVDEGRTGFLVAAGDVDALAERLARLTGDAAMRSAFGTAARAHAMERFRSDQVAARVAAVYRQVLNETEARDPSRTSARIEGGQAPDVNP